jgi:hypothetical protein
VLDSEYHVWGSRDGGGVTWTPGSVVTETRQITLLPETPAGSYPLQVGLFHSETDVCRSLPTMVAIWTSVCSLVPSRCKKDSFTQRRKGAKKKPFFHDEKP